MDLLCIIAVVCFILYKVLDRVLRIPTTSAPTAERDYILITGCDSGFGNLLAKRLDGKGFHVFASCLTQQGKDDLEATTSSRLKAVLMDITDQESIGGAFRFVDSNLPKENGLWALVNNAGVATGPTAAFGPAEWLNTRDYAEVFNLNVGGMVSVTNSFLPLLKKSRGRIVNTASILGRIAPAAFPYCASKFAVEAYSDGIRRELLPFGVSVHIIEPGYFATSMSNPAGIVSTIEKRWNALSPEMKEEYGEDFFEKFTEKKKVDLQAMRSPKLHLVVDAYEHAVLGTFPRARYMVGADANFFLWPLSLVPEWVSDRILTTGEPVPRGARC